MGEVGMAGLNIEQQEDLANMMSGGRFVNFKTVIDVVDVAKQGVKNDPTLNVNDAILFLMAYKVHELRRKDIIRVVWDVGFEPELRSVFFSSYKEFQDCVGKLA